MGALVGPALALFEPVVAEGPVSSLSVLVSGEAVQRFAKSGAETISVTATSVSGCRSTSSVVSNGRSPSPTVKV